MSKALITGDDWTDDAVVLEIDVLNALKPIMAKYVSLGYSVREIVSVMNETAYVAGLDTIFRP